MTVFGDMDISTLKERPRGESMIETHVVEAASKPAHLQRAWQRVREEVGLGNQVYIVAPRISASDDSDFERYGLSAADLNLAKKLAGVEPGEEIYGGRRRALRGVGNGSFKRLAIRDLARQVGNRRETTDDGGFRIRFDRCTCYNYCY
jgi:hypothetical protein